MKLCYYYISSLVVLLCMLGFILYYYFVHCIFLYMLHLQGMLNFGHTNWDKYAQTTRDQWINEISPHELINWRGWFTSIFFLLHICTLITIILPQVIITISLFNHHLLLFWHLDLQVHYRFGLMPEAFCLTTNLLSGYLSIQLTSRRNYQLVGSIAMLLAYSDTKIKWVMSSIHFYFLLLYNSYKTL